MIPELRLRVDACFLSNPYATDLFLDYLHREVIRTGKLRRLLEFYPSQNRVIADKLSGTVGVPTEYLFVGNGAIEIIQAILHRFTGAKILVNLPTFSPYHEFVRSDTQVLYNVLPRENDFRFDPKPYLERVRREKPDTVVLINPNNPDGGYIPYATLVHLLEDLRHVPNVILDESFIHFACEGDDYAYRSLCGEVDRFPNLMVVKSMSKDFGVAGIRAGFAVMAPQRVQSLLNNGYLWNSSGLAEYFFDLYSRPDFLIEYERKRVHYIRHSRRFFKALSLMPGLHAYPTCANFVLIELRNEMTAEDLVCRLLVRRGIYTRTCDDKKGLEPGKFIRVASRCRSENRFVLRLPRHHAVRTARAQAVLLIVMSRSLGCLCMRCLQSPGPEVSLSGLQSDQGLSDRLAAGVSRQTQPGHLEVSSLARGSRFFVSRFVASDRQNTATDQVREPLPLFRAQERVDLLQGIDQRVANFRGALYASFAGTAGLGGIERLAGNGIGELRQGAAVVHLGLCPFRLELVQDSGQFGDLLLVQIELVGEESERPSDAKP